MKKLLLILFAALLILGCQKEFGSANNEYVETVRTGLQDSLRTGDLEALDFSKASRSCVDSVGLYYLRIPFLGKKPYEDFVLVKTNKKGSIERGSIIHLQGKITASGNVVQTVAGWNGNISVASFDRRTVLESPIENGYITAFHQRNSYRSDTQEPQGEVMPEVIITYTISSGGDMSWSSWFRLQYLTSTDANGVGGGGGSYYSDFSGGDSSGGGGSYNGGDRGGGANVEVFSDPVIQVDMEIQDEDPPIDIERFINCFNAIPDAGATCSIEILADIPVDSDSNKIFNFTSRSPGHTFLTIRKSNGSQSVSQNVGFYPKEGWKTILTNAPIDGKLVDNGQHEFNCGFKLTITPAQLRSAIVQMQQSKNYKYDIDNYNCTDWALDVFNAAGGNLQIPLFDVPGNYPSTGTRMPNGIYHKLREMKNSGDPRAGGITIGLVKGFAGNSTGPCN